MVPLPHTSYIRYSSPVNLILIEPRELAGYRVGSLNEALKAKRSQ